ncbi:MAG: hypothetical protein HC866_24435 [Leptolyngbyaceae cyanobacterium RU_5_1]|nr:hypothetical protein [Leptolyngbyaceae cyanobacterium RU_5_1]
MSIIVTSEEIAQYRTELSEYSEALVALDVLEDCEGNLEDASISLAIQAGQEPDTSDRWIDGLAKRWRHVICQVELKEKLEEGLQGEAITALTASTSLPLKLATLVAIYVVRAGAESFCEPLQEKL